MHGKRVRRRDIEDLPSELEYIKKDMHFTTVVNFQDDYFLASGQEHIDTFCARYKERIGLPFYGRTVPSFVKEERIAALKKAGLVGVSMGLQTGDDHIAREVYNRKTTNRDFCRAAEIINRSDIWGVYDVTLEGPYETDESNCKTAKTLMELPKPFALQVFHMVLFPKTVLEETCQRENITVPGDPYETGYGIPV